MESLTYQESKILNYIILAPLPADQHSFLKSIIHPTVLLRIYSTKIS